MTTLRQFKCDDLFKYNGINLDPLTETYGVGFYLQYLAKWPEYFLVAETPGKNLMGYIMGKAEGEISTFMPEFSVLKLEHIFFQAREKIGTAMSLQFQLPQNIEE